MNIGVIIEAYVYLINQKAYMKKLLIIVLTVLAFSSCEKDSLVPKSELPQWLVSKIESDEAQIKINPKSMIAAGKWTRVEWNAFYYYEYENFLSSSILPPIAHTRDTLSFYNQTLMDNYINNKCCDKLVWKGPMSLK